MLDKLSLNLYLFLTFLFLPFIKIIVKWRINYGKEHPTRWREKLGIPNVARPSGKLIWLHAVGLGEVLALRGLIEKLHRQEEKLNFLVTSSTVMSAEVFEKNIISFFYSSVFFIASIIPLDAFSLLKFLIIFKP